MVSIPGYKEIPLYQEANYPEGPARSIEVTCFQLRVLPFMHLHDSIDFFVGNSQGQLIHYTKNFASRLNDKKEIMIDHKSEGPITTFQCFDKDLIVYSTAVCVRVLSYEKKQKICMIKIPPKYPTFPDEAYSSKMNKPTFMWRKLKID